MPPLISKAGQSGFVQSALLLAACLLLYGQTLGFSYVWDDGLIFLDNSALMNEPLSWALVSAPFLENVNYLRPLILTSWWLEFHLFGQNPAVSHAINLAIFCINVLLLCAVTRQVLLQRKQANAALWATIAALTYAIHPCLTEAAAWVSGRFDLLCTTGILASALIFIRPSGKPLPRALGVTFFTAIALGSKELGVVLPAMLFCVWMAARSRPDLSLANNLRQFLRENVLTWLLLALLLAVYFVLRRISIHDVYTPTWSWHYAQYLWDSQLPLRALQFYMSIALWPFGRIGIVHSVTPINATIIAANLLALLVTAFVLWQALMRRRDWAWLLLGAYAGIALVVHGIPMTIGNNVAQDRFMTAPLAFACMALAVFPWRTLGERIGLTARARRLAGSLALGGWLACAMLVSATVIPLWSRPELLWRWTSQQNPDNPFVSYNYMEASLSAGYVPWIEAEVERLRKKNGGLEPAEQQLFAQLLLRRGDREAMPYLEGVIFALIKYHELPDGRELAKLAPMTMNQISGTYSAYALAKLMFDGDLKSAENYLGISDWYLRDGQRDFNNYLKASLLYCSSRFDEADAALAYVTSRYQHNKGALVRQMTSVVDIYCDNETKRVGERPEVCVRLDQRHFFKPPTP